MARRALILLPLCLVAACGVQPQAERDAVYDDPKMDLVLFEPIMIDPDLSQQNRRMVVVEPGGVADTSLPGPFPKEPGQASRTAQ